MNEYMNEFIPHTYEYKNYIWTVWMEHENE
jgi:hypothetical protein